MVGPCGYVGCMVGRAKKSDLSAQSPDTKASRSLSPGQAERQEQARKEAAAEAERQEQAHIEAAADIKPKRRSRRISMGLGK